MQIELANEVKRTLRRALRQAGRQEIGGMMFAEQIAPSHFDVMDISLEMHSGSQSTFERDPEPHSQALKEFFRRTGHDFDRFNYLGEWHSHPSFSVHPSCSDVATMTELVENGNDISFAILMIVRLRFLTWIDCTFTVVSQGGAPETSNIVRIF